MCLCVRLIGRALVTLALLKSVEETDNFPPKYRRFSERRLLLGPNYSIFSDFL